MGMNDDLSSTRPVDRRHAQYDQGPPPMNAQPYEYRRRPNERIFGAPVTSVQAVVGAPTEECWIERHQVTSGGGIDPGRTLMGAVLGGVIGHQIGNGSGRNLATAGGAVAGAAIGANSGRSEPTTLMQDVHRCRSVASTVPTYCDVTYAFRGVNHRLRMNSDPGNTVSVNRHGDPWQQRTLARGACGRCASGAAGHGLRVRLQIGRIAAAGRGFEAGPVGHRQFAAAVMDQAAALQHASRGSISWKRRQAAEAARCAISTYR